MLLRMALISALEYLRTSSPSNSTSPSVLSISLSMTLPRVDLPQPDSPTTPSVFPFSILKDRSSTACSRPWGVLGYFYICGRLFFTSFCGIGTAGMELTAFGKVYGVGHQAVNRCKPFLLILQIGNRVEQAYSIGMLPCSVDILDRTGFHYLPRIHYGYFAAHFHDYTQVVGN